MPTSANALSASRADLDSLAPNVVERYDPGDEVRSSPLASRTLSLLLGRG